MLTLLEKHGYVLARTYKGKHGIGYRFLAPQSTTGMPGVIMDQNAADKWTVYSHHGDVLGQPVTVNGKPQRVQHDAFDLYRVLEHGGDAKAALGGVGREGREAEGVNG